MGWSPWQRKMKHTRACDKGEVKHGRKRGKRGERLVFVRSQGQQKVAIWGYGIPDEKQSQFTREVLGI